MKHLARLVLLVALMTVPIRAAERIPIFITSAGTADGFTDPSKARQDSLKDIRKRVADSKTLRLAESNGDAVAIIEVVERSTKSERNGWTAINGQRQNKSTVTVRLTAGSFTTEFTGESGSKGVGTGYSDAAKKVVRQVEAWVTANSERLAAARQ